MHRTARIVLASLFALALHSAAQAGIVLTAVQTSPLASQNVTVNLYATWDGLQTGGGIPNSSRQQCECWRLPFFVPRLWARRLPD